MSTEGGSGRGIRSRAARDAKQIAGAIAKWLRMQHHGPRIAHFPNRFFGKTVAHEVDKLIRYTANVQLYISWLGLPLTIEQE